MRQDDVKLRSFVSPGRSLREFSTMDIALTFDHPVYLYCLLVLIAAIFLACSVWRMSRPSIGSHAQIDREPSDPKRFSKIGGSRKDQ